MSQQKWKYSNAQGRWAGFGPYYAMFPGNFARQVVETMSPEGGRILDPFCGRGTAPFMAQVTGRASLGIDINPVAWVFAKVKTAPEPNPEKLLKRLENLIAAVRPKDKKAEVEFQSWAWSEKVLGFLNSARRELDWRENITDRTLMGFILVHLHDRASCGISNQMQKSRAMGPDYAIRWWKKREMSPPAIDPYEYFLKRIRWRYTHGVIDNRQATEIARGDAAQILSDYQAGTETMSKTKTCADMLKVSKGPALECLNQGFSLLFTSPPYFGVTDYRQDSWIRLWMLGEGPSLPDWKKDKTAVRQELYRQMLEDVFLEASKLLKPYGVVWIRTDARAFTKNTTLQIIRTLWPRRKLFMRYDRPAKLTQTAHFGNISTKPGEIDFLIPGRRPLPDTVSPWEQL